MHGVYSMIVERAKNCHKFKRFEVKSSIQTVQAKPHITSKFEMCKLTIKLEIEYQWLVF